jgi:Uma2 family endonuclease
MATATHISIEQYLKTSYEPDAEFVDGEVEERNVGEYDHNAVQKAILLWFARHEREWGIRCIQEQRTRLGASRVRIPDVSLFSRELPIEQVFTRPQLVAIEVLSPEDRHSKVQEKIDDYRAFRIPNIWIVDPVKRIGWDCSDGNWTRCDRFAASNSALYLDLHELFDELDAAEA